MSEGIVTRTLKKKIRQKGRRRGCSLWRFCRGGGVWDSLGGRDVNKRVEDHWKDDYRAEM